ncbi:Sugar lactone lactonase YvrE [Granulicella rosea]|uniref:Sugar lactone lactonase YvrE n=1 Tax=Granulicella rosea TaxID=474952 RepID=A0A239MMA7_9BACT|nr:chitobiase/beta-hexosaminidase C-terminal domain-containing protein [Granulicella rosea]SNT43234.1 Sugar lactone lactonase YvrE [Granulicella rosea]
MFKLRLSAFASTASSVKTSTAAVFSVAFAACLALTGCTHTPTPTPVSTTGYAIKGLVHGGQQPVSGATIQLYAVGATGDGSPSQALLTKTVTTSDGSGNASNSNANAGNQLNSLPVGTFGITGDYTCPSASTEVYLVSTGGNPGFASPVNNSDLILLAALGPCGSLTPATFITLNEVTTVGSTAALYPYMASYAAIGSGTSDATSLASAFSLAAEYVNVASGTAPGTTLPAGYYASSVEIDTLANILAACINSTGGVAKDGSNCGMLLQYTTPANGTAPTETVGAILNILKNPTLNVANLFNLSTANAPFQPALPAPNPDWTLPILPMPATPTFSLAAGTYTGAQTATIAETTTGATVYYTTNGTTPTIFSSVYSGGAIAIAASETLTAVAYLNRAPSAIASAAYTIITPVTYPGAVTFSPMPGDYATAQTVTLSAPTSGAIYYTTDGSTPTTSSTRYTAPISVPASETISAIATATGYVNSSIVSGGYFINQGSGIISTYAGGIDGDTGDGAQASNAEIYGIAPAVDGSGNLYFVSGNIIRKITPTGVISTLTIPAALSSPSNIAFDKGGNLYIADQNDILVRKFTTAGTISTIAGFGGVGFSGDGGLATAAKFTTPFTVGLDNTGLAYIADTGNYRVRKVDASGIITTVVGNGSAAFSGDGGPATSAGLTPNSVAFDAAGNMYIADSTNYRIRKVDTNGIITTIAGTGVRGSTGDGGPALSATLYGPTYISSDAAGNLYFMDNQRVRRIDSSGVITTVAGTGAAGYNGDFISATTAQLNVPQGVGVDSTGNLYIADTANYRIRKVTYFNPNAAATPTFSVAAGTYTSAQVISLSTTTPGATIHYTTDGSLPTATLAYTTSAVYTGPITLTTSQTIKAIAVLPGYSNNSAVASAAYVIQIPVASAPILSPAPGNYAAGQTVTISSTTGAIYYTTDGSAPTTSSTLYTGPITVQTSETISAISFPSGYASSTVTAGGYFLNQGVGVINTIAGDGETGYYGDGVPATSTPLSTPTATAVDSSGNLYIADSVNYRIRKVTPAGIISTIAGTGVSGSTGEGGPATLAQIGYPGGVVVDNSGNVYFSDGSIHRIAPDGVISTVVAGASQSFIFDQAGNIYFTYPGQGQFSGIGSRVYKMDHITHGLTLIAGNGTAGYSGDGPAISAELSYQIGGIALDTSGNLYIADPAYNRILKVDTTGYLTTAVGAGTPGLAGGFGGDGGPASAALLNNPSGIAFDTAGNLYIVDTDNDRIRKVTPAGIISTVAGKGGTPSYGGDGGSPLAASFSFVYYAIDTLTIDSFGNLYLADTYNQRVRKITYSTGLAAATPVFSPAAGSYSAAQTVSISTSSPDTSIYYTTDGSTPTTSSNIYTAPITVAASQTVNAIATGAGYTSSPVASAAYTITGSLPYPGAVTFSPAPGNYSIAQTVSITAPISGAVYYTTDGSTPTTSSTLYTGPITVSTPETINAIATATGYTSSSVVSAGYFINQGIGIISTVAGDGISGYTGDGSQATGAELAFPYTTVMDRSGNLYITNAAGSCSCVRKVTPAGVISIIAGSPGHLAYGGDGGPATTAYLNYPEGLAIDSAGNLYIGDSLNLRIRKVDTTGNITTVAGTGAQGSSGDGGLATSATLSNRLYVAVDGSGNLYIADIGNNKIRKVNSAGIISTVAGNGTAGFSGDGGPATSAQLSYPSGVAVDGAGNIYIADESNNRIRKVNSAGVISTVAGTGVQGFSGDGFAATSATLNQPFTVNVDTAGNFYFADAQRFRKVDPSGIITTVAGNGTAGYNSDGINAVTAELNNPTGIFADSIGNLYLTDWANSRVRKVTYSNAYAATPTFSVASGIYTSVQVVAITTATTGASIYYTTDGTTPTTTSSLYSAPVTVRTSETLKAIAVQTSLLNNSSVAIANYVISLPQVASTPTFSPAPGNYAAGQTVTLTSSSGGPIYYTTDGSTPTTSSTLYTGAITVAASETINAFAAPTGYVASSVASGGYYINQGIGIITTIAGTGTSGYNGDGIAATSAQLYSPYAVAVDNSGNVYIDDWNNYRIRKVTPAGVISTFAGTGVSGFSGDGGAASAAQIGAALGVAVDSSGNVYIADSTNNRVRKVTPAGIISTIAGNGTRGFTGDGGAATSAELAYPQALAFDSNGNLYIADAGTYRVRKIDTSGIISTIAGNGTTGFSGDGAIGTSASLANVGGIAADASGNVYIADIGNNRIRKVNAAGIISTFAGTGTKSFSGDGAAAASATLNLPNGIFADTAGNLYIVDSGNERIRKVTTGGIISTVAGNGGSGYSGDGVNATTASLYFSTLNPTGMWVDKTGNLYLADTYNQRVRKVSYSNAFTASAPIFSLASGSYTSTQYLSLSTSSPGVPIYYTIDGSTPTAASTLYTAPIAISASQTVKAFASGGGYAASSVSSAAYSVTLLPAAATPTFSPAAGTFTAAQTVTISTTSGTPIYYTTDGSNPTSASTLYTGPVTVSSSETINAITLSASYTASLTATAGYYINPAAGIINTVIGNGAATYGGDGGPGINASVNNPTGVAMDGSGNLYIADTANNRIRMVTPAGIITTVAGNGSTGYYGDGGQATAAWLNAPRSVAVDLTGNIFIADTGNNVIRRISPNGIIVTVAGTGISGFSGDGGQGTSAMLANPVGLAVDRAGNLYIADYTNNRIRRLSPGGVINTVVGGGSNDWGYGGLATNMAFNKIFSVAIDASGNLYVGDERCHVAEVNPAGIVTMLAGSPSYYTVYPCYFSGDGGSATGASATIYQPYGLAVDSAGNVYIATGDDRIRVVSQAGIINTIIGNGVLGFTGDGGLASAGQVNFNYYVSTGIVTDSKGNIYFSDSGNQRIRKITH